LEQTSLEQLSQELIDNLIIRIDQIGNLPLEESNLIRERFVYLTNDLEVLVEGINSLKIEVEFSDLDYILNTLLESMENNDYFYLKEVIKFELSPLLLHWSDTIKNEQN
jgi:hypothetical protein